MTTRGRRLSSTSKKPGAGSTGAARQSLGLKLISESYLKGERIIGVLRDLIGDRAIESLPVAFTAVATDLDSGEEVWLREGPLFDAIRASIATPMVFTPFKHGTRTLLDGALVNPLPIAATIDDTTDLTIVVSLSGRAETRLPPAPEASAPAANGNEYRQRVRAFIENLYPARTPSAPARGLLDVALASMQTMQDTITRLKLADYSPDVTVEIPRNACGYVEFWRAQEMIALGRERIARSFSALASSSPAALSPQEPA